MSGLTLPLAGLNVLITRPVERAGELNRALAEAGARVRHQPLLVLTALDPQHDMRCQRNRALAQELDRYQRVICVSVTAVEFGLEVLADFWPQWPMGQSWYGVGAATAAALAEHDLVASQPGGAMNSEALLALPEWQQVAGERILIVRGVGGRDYLAEQLRQRGAQVDFLECYRRQAPALSPAELAEQVQDVDAVCLNSGETLERFEQLWHQAGRDSADLNATLVVPGERVARLAAVAGFSHCLTARNAGTEATLTCLADWWGQRLKD